MFRELDKEHPRMSQTAKEIVPVDLTAVPRQSFSESMLKEHGSLWTVKEDASAVMAVRKCICGNSTSGSVSNTLEYGDEASDQSARPSDPGSAG